VLDYALLGPTQVSDAGRVLALGGQRQRVLLTILLLGANQPVSRDALVDRLWGDHPPGGAQHALEVYISRLRKVLEPAAGGQVLLAQPGAYLLRTAPESIDVCRFERLVEQGRCALAAGTPGQAAATLGAALAVWRGPPLADVSDEPFAQAEIARLAELRSSVIEDRIEADLAVGRHSGVVSELEALVAAHPLRERPRQQLMIALYRCGRQADALAAYQSARQVLLDELGLEPGPALRRTERAILAQDASLDLPAPPAVRAAAERRHPPRAARHPRGLAAAVLGFAVVLLLVISGSTGSRGTSAALSAGPDTIGIIDGRHDVLRDVVTSTGRPGGIAHGAGATWVTDTADNLLLRVNPAGQVVDRIPVGRGPAGVAVGLAQVWVANQLDDTVSEVNPVAGRVVATIGVGNGPARIATGYGAVWVVNVTDSTLSRIDPARGRVVASVPVGSTPGDVAAGDGGIWVTSPETGRVLLVDPSRDRVTREFPADGFPVAMTIGAGRVWTADSGGAVSQLDPLTGQVRSIRTGDSADGIAYANGAIWVANSLRGYVSKIDVSGGDPGPGSVQRIHVGNQPADLAAAGPDVLAMVLPAPASYRGGTLTAIANVAPPDQATDPAVAYSIPIWQMLSVTNDGLVGYARAGGPAGNSLVPDLAQTLPAAANHGLTYVFRLRPHIRYSTGALVRPEDFRLALERVFRLSYLGGAAPLYSGLVGARACLQAPSHCDLARGVVTDDRAGTVTFHLTAPDPNFLYKLAFPFADAVPAGTPRHLVSPVQLPATGPYVTQSFVPGQRWVLIRNPRFRPWSDIAQPSGYPDRIVLRLDVRPGPGVDSVLHGRADVLLSPPPARLPELATRYASQLHSGPLGATVGLVLNTRTWPFRVLAARQAVNYAVDRNRLIQLIGGPLTGQPTCQILPPAMLGYQPYCPYTLDPGPAGVWTAPNLARAEHLVSASGTRGAKVTVLTGAFGAQIPYLATGRYLVSVLNQLGYRASLRVITNYNEYNRKFYDSRQRMQAGWFSWYQDYPAPSDFFNPLLTCRSFIPDSLANLNAAEFCSPSVDAQIRRAALVQPDNASSAGARYAQIDRDIVDQAPWVPIYNPRSLVMLSARVGNYQFNPYWSLLIDQLWVR
jgi:YVTN family beta-propeller protein